MRLTLAIFLLNILPLALLGQADSQHQQSQQKRQTVHGQTANEKPSPPDTEVRAQEEPEHSIADKGKENHNPPWYKKPEWVAVGLTAIYVGITGWYVVVSHRTMNQIVRQADIADKAANAAQKSANALITGERAWLLIDAIEADPDFAKQATPRFTFRVANFGKTPGFMIGAKAYVQLSSEFDIPKEFIFIELKGARAFEGVIAPAGKPMTIPSESWDFPFSDAEEAQRPRIFANPPEAWLWVCGSIHYHDVFGQVRVTPFAYWYDATGKKFVRSNWPEINKPT